MEATEVTRTISTSVLIPARAKKRRSPLTRQLLTYLQPLKKKKKHRSTSRPRTRGRRTCSNWTTQTQRTRPPEFSAPVIRATQGLPSRTWVPLCWRGQSWNRISHVISTVKAQSGWVRIPTWKCPWRQVTLSKLKRPGSAAWLLAESTKATPWASKSLTAASRWWPFGSPPSPNTFHRASGPLSQRSITKSTWLASYLRRWRILLPSVTPLGLRNQNHPTHLKASPKKSCLMRLQWKMALPCRLIRRTPAVGIWMSQLS